MAPNRKGSGHQAKHYQPEDHAHAAHQEAASRGHQRKPSGGGKGGGKSASPKPGHPVELTPKGSRKGQ